MYDQVNKAVIRADKAKNKGDQSSWRRNWIYNLNAFQRQ
jgi:hypothetical protein